MESRNFGAITSRGVRSGCDPIASNRAPSAELRWLTCGEGLGFLAGWPPALATMEHMGCLRESAKKPGFKHGSVLKWDLEPLLVGISRKALQKTKRKGRSFFPQRLQANRACQLFCYAVDLTELNCSIQGCKKAQNFVEITPQTILAQLAPKMIVL